MRSMRKTYTWDEANKQIASLNAKKYRGKSDWRLPTVEELISIVDYTHYNPATTVPDTVASGYWSSTTYASSTSNAWYVGFYYGYVGTNGKTGYNYVRAVRGRGTKLEWSKTIRMVVVDCCACPYCNIHCQLCEHGNFRFDKDEMVQIETQEMFIPERCGLLDYEP